jgi:cell shape-determining protein MreC
MKRWWLLVILASGLYLADSRGRLGFLIPVKRWFFELKQPQTVSLEEIETTILEAQAVKLKEENSYLRKLLGANLPANWQLQPAKIIRIDKDKLVIDSGDKEGVKTGMVVLALEKIVIGRVAQINPVQAEVGLVDGALVKTESGATGKLKRQNQSLQLIEVRQEFVLKEGELILTAGKDGWPPDLVVGRVGQIERVETAVYQSATVVPIINYADLSEVMILLDSL